MSKQPMDVINVNLTFDEAMSAVVPAAIQIMRKVQSNRNSDHGGYSTRSIRDRWGDGVNGYMGQLAACKALGMCWTIGGSEVSSGDIGSDIEVRTTHYETGKLLIYDRDDDGKYFVLAVGQYPAFKVYPAILAKNCKKDEFWNAKADPPCWWVPQSFLLEEST